MTTENKDLEEGLEKEVDIVEDVSEEVEETTEEAEENANVEEEKADDTDKSDKKKKKGFKKKDKRDEQIEELNDKYQRLFAEFQNFRSRSDKEKSAMFEVGARSIVEKILPVVDNIERGVAALSEEDLDSPVGQGMNLIYKQLLQTLEDMGVEAIEAKGQEFDPELHNAVMHEDNDEFGENIVSEELQKGYKYKDTVVRHSMVKVAN
ncbi:MAG: nucleotide exchange factor GrpE [Eubacterium sp.]|jgi:molecular chaperone GrpE|nr:nucleotide exchange factor GrpE [Eubacterium sp.]